MLEFDVRAWRGRLVLAHTVLDAGRPGCLELEPALRWLAAELDERVQLVVDLKSVGTEAAVLDALRRHGLLERAILTSQCRPVLRRIHELGPGTRTGISVAGRVSRRVQRWGPWRDEVVADVAAGHYSAVMVHRRLVDRQLVEHVREAGAQVHAWTVRGAGEAATLSRLGVDGIVTVDPRLVPP
jgi:glycerophosphoryl diester phosphodiesterase